jgi:hypothetical protein
MVTCKYHRHLRNSIKSNEKRNKSNEKRSPWRHWSVFPVTPPGFGSKSGALDAWQLMWLHLQVRGAAPASADSSAAANQ